MDTAILAQLNAPLVDQAFQVAAIIEDLQQDLDAIIDRLNDAGAFLQDLQSGSATAREQLQAIVDLGEIFVSTSTDLKTLLGIDTAEINACLTTVKNGLTNLAALNTAAIQALDQVATIYRRFDAMRKDGGELAVAHAAFTDYVTKWLNQDFEFSNDGSPITVRFTSSLGNQFPFGANANLAATVTLKGIAAKVEKVGLKVNLNSTKVDPHFESAKFSAGFDINSFAQEIIGGLSFDLPGGVTLDNPAVHLNQTPPNITVDGGVKGIPGFDALSFDATFSISTNEITIVNASGGVGTIIVPIPPGVLAMKGIVAGFQSTPLTGFDPPLPVPALQIGTAMNPLADGATGTTISFDVQELSAGNGIFFPLKNFGTVFAFRGSLVLLKLFRCGTVQGLFTAQPLSLSARLTIGDTSQPSPFGSGDIFSLNANATIDENGIVFDGDATYFKFIHGEISGDISFKGGGHITASANADIKILAASATFSADWAPGFANLIVEATASVSVPIRGFSAPVVSAQIVCTGNDQSKQLLVSAKIMGFLISKEELDTSENLGDFLASLVKLPNLEEFAKQLFERGKKLLNALGGIEKNPFLARALGSLNPLKEFANAVPEAKEIFEKADKTIDETRKQVEAALGNAGNVVAGTVKKVGGVARNVGKSIGLGLVGGSDAPDFVFPTDLPSDFIDDIADLLDDFFKQAKLTKAARELSEKLDSADFRITDQGRASGSDARVDTRLDVVFDQVILGAQGVDPETSSAKSAFVAFYLIGGSSTRRRGQTANESFANWGVVNFTLSSTHGLMVTIDLKVDEQPLADASLLHARHKIYSRLKSLVLAISPGIKFGDDAHAQGDPNDPGPEPPVDLNFGQPPSTPLPVLGTLGVERVSVGASGARIIKMTPGGAAESSGLVLDDIIQKVNGTPVTSAAILGAVIKASQSRKVKLEVKLNATLTDTVKDVELDPIQLES